MRGSPAEERRGAAANATRLGACLVVLAVVAVAFRPLWSGLGAFNDDYPAVYLRIHQYFQEFRHGHLPAAFPDVVQGGGSAFPLFYPPLAYYIGAGVYAIVGDMVWAGHLAALLSLLLSAASMMWVARQLGAPPAVAVMAGLAYATFPYRFTNVLVRGALAESWALVWLPLVFGSAVRLVRNAGSGLPLAFWTSLLLLTHTGLALWSLPLVLVTALAGCRRARLSRATLEVVGWTAAGAGLAAWYLLPTWYYLPTVRASDPEVMFATAREFVRWRVEWRQAVGVDPLVVHPVSGRPLQVPMALSIGLSSLVLPFALVLGQRAARKAKLLPAGGIPTELAAAMTAAVGLLVVVYPRLVSGWVPGPWLYLQFPYRLLGVAGMLATIAAAVAIGKLVGSRSGLLLFLAWGAVVGWTVIFEARRPQPAWQASHADLVPLLARRDKGLTARYEYFPKTNEPETVGPRVQAARDSLRARAIHLRDTTNELQVTLHLEQPTRVVLPRVAYAFLAVEDHAGRGLPVFAENGLLAVELPAGANTLSVKRRMPWPIGLGITVSLLAAVLLGVLAPRRVLKNST